MLRNRGITLIELLVVLGIVALLIAILLPAVQAARLAIRKADCAHRLRQIGIAMHAYESTNKVFPSAAYATHDDGFGRQGANMVFSPHSQILAYVGEAQTFNSINFSAQAFLDPSHATALSIRVNTFVCPSDNGHPKTNLWTAEGQTSYRVNLGPTTCFYGEPSAGSGAFSVLAHHRTTDFQDGLSNTVMMSEKLRGDGDDGTFRLQQDWWWANISLNPIPPTPEVITVCSSLTTPNPPHRSSYGIAWLYAGYPYTWYNHAVGPNSDTPDCAPGNPQFVGPSESSAPGVRAARSNHSGGVNCLFGDNSVRFISNSIDLDVWRAISTRASGETLSSGY